MIKNSDEYRGYIETLADSSFLRHLVKLSKKCKGKKVLFYGCGIFFDALIDLYKINDYFDILGVSDISFSNSDVTDYRGFKTIKPDEIKQSEADIVIISTNEPDRIINYFKNQNVLRASMRVDVLIKKTDDLSKKMKSTFEYLKISKNPLKSLKYLTFLDTTEINSKINYLKKINEIKKRDLKTQPIRVLFIVEENQKWGYQSLYEEFRLDNNFEVLPIVCFPIITKNRIEKTQSANIEFFTNSKMNALDGYNEEKNEYLDIKTLNPDIVFYQQPWYIRDAWHPKNVSKYALCAIVSYGYSSISVESWGSNSVRALSGNLWKMFAESKYHKVFYETAAKIRHKDILKVTGYPKFDSYYTKINPDFEKLWNDVGHKKPHLIWAPHYSVDSSGLSMSNFVEQYSYFLDFIKNNEQYGFIFKPHPMLRSALIEAKLMTNIEYDNFINELNELDNATVYDKGNYFDIFKTSDILITDCSSFLGEYYFSKKPIIFLDKSTRCDFNKFGEKMKKTFYILDEITKLPNLIESILINDNKLDERIKLIEKEYFYPKMGVAKYIINYIKHELFIKKAD